MKNIVVAIKFPDGNINSVLIESNNLPELVNDVRLYENNIDFIKSFVDEYGINHILFPVSDGLLVIDMVDKQIYDSQGYTGIFKITPSEIKSSYSGNIVGETAEKSISKRFKEALKSNRLKGFEEWFDSGTQLNTKVLEMDMENLIAIVESNKSYGQFIFNTTPYKVTAYEENDYHDQHELFKILSEKGFIGTVKESWLERLEKLKVSD